MMRAISRVALVALSALLVSPVVAQSDEAKLGLGVRTPVTEGQAHPALLLNPTVSVETAKITVKRRGDGKQLLFDVAGLRKGQSKILELPQPVGTSAYEARFEVRFADGSTSSFAIAFEATSTSGLELDIGQRDVDLDARTLKLKASRPVSSVQVVVYGDDDVVLGRTEQAVGGARGARAATVRWTQRDGVIRRLDIKATDAQGFWSGIEIRAFYVDPWEDRIYFATGSDAIEASERGKLEATLARIREASRTAREEYGSGLDLRLYIAGYTDTVGSKASNLELSRRRARSIGRYFAGQGLDLPIYYQGFGEDVLAVDTPDDTPEERNRRTLYVLSSQTPISPAFPRGNWKRLD